MKSDKMNIYLDSFRDHYKAAKNNFTQTPLASLGSIRTALESAVRILWLKKYDKEPVWIINGQETFNLYEATNDSRIYSLFNSIRNSDIKTIRTCGNKAGAHPGKIYTADDVKDLLHRLEKIVEEIENIIGVDIIEKPSTPTQTVFVDTAEYKHVSQKTSISVISVNKEKHSETVEKNYKQGDKIMRSGEIIRVRTNAELLNELFGLNYKAWMKSVYDFDDKRVWMIHLDNQERNGWKNYKIKNTIIEENLYPDDLTGLRVDVRPNNLRVVFSKHNNHFVFEGIYMYDKERSDASKIRYWQKVAEEF